MPDDAPPACDPGVCNPPACDPGVPNPEVCDPAGGQERGVSDVIGYVIIFSLVVASVTFVLLSGMGSLQETRENERATTAERALDVVHDNMAAIYERNAPSRSTEIDLTKSEIFYDNNVSIEVIGDGSQLARTELRPVVMRVSDDEDLVYEAGAVFRDQRRGGLMLNEPPFLITEDRIHLPIVQTTSEAYESAGGTTILLRGQATDRTVLESGNSYADLTIEIASPRYEFWEEYLDDKDALTCSTDDATETVECSTASSTDIVYVTRHQIELSLVL